MLYGLFIGFALLAVFAMALGIWLAVRLFAEAKLSGIFRTGIEGENMTFALTDAYFPHVKCLRKIWFAAHGGIPCYAEQVLISEAGIFIVSSFGEKGRIQNPISEDWMQLRGKQSRLIANPFLKNYDIMTTIEALFETAGLPPPMIYSLVVTTELQVSFTDEYDLLVPADEFPACMRRLSRNRSLGRRMMRKYIHILERGRVSAPIRTTRKQT